MWVPAIRSAPDNPCLPVSVWDCFSVVLSSLVLLKGDVLSGFFTTESAVIRNAYAYLKGFAPETLLTAVLFSMIGYFNGNDKTFWVMCQD